MTAVLCRAPGCGHPDRQHAAPGEHPCTSCPCSAFVGPAADAVRDDYLCGACGRPIGRYRVVRGQLVFNTWRHTGDVTGLLPHAAILGVPGRRATVEDMTAALGDADAARDLWDLLYGREAKPKRVHHHAEEIPAPRVPARPANENEIPASARSVRNVAVEHGWEVRAVYAIGPLISADGYGVLREVESLSLRLHRGGQRLVVVWERAWSPDGPVMLTKRTKCAGCRSLTCDGCELGTGTTETIEPAKWEHDSSWLVTPSTAPVRLTDLKAQLVQPEAYCHRCGQVLGNHIADPRAGYICPIQPEEGVA